MLSKTVSLFWARTQSCLGVRQVPKTLPFCSAFSNAFPEILDISCVSIVSAKCYLLIFPEFSCPHISCWHSRPVIFPECVARVPVSFWGCGGCVYVRNRSQPSATVRNRSQVSARGRDGRAYGKSCKTGHFWMFSASLGFLSRGRRRTL